MPILKPSSQLLPRGAASLAALLTAFAALPATAAVVTVGSAPTCTRPTIQAAIDHVANLGPGHHTIRISGNGDPNATWTENLRLGGSNLDVDLVGGHASCAASAPSGRTTISGELEQTPTLRITGNGTITLRNLVIRDGTRDPLTTTAGGVYWYGHGTLSLADTSIMQNDGFGIEVHAQDADGTLDFLGGVAITGNSGGIRAQNRARVRVHSNGNEIADNEGSGLILLGGSSIDAYTTGALVRGNRGGGLIISGYGHYPGRGSRLDSSDPQNPLAIVDNHLGAIALESMDEPSWVCTRNVRIDDNGDLPEAASTVAVRGNAFLEMNTPCNWPTQASVCPSRRGGCNSVTGNRAANASPVFEASGGGSIVADRLWIEENDATSLFSTNRDGQSSSATIVATNSAMLDNALVGPVVESRDGAHVQIRASTIRGASGAATFVGVTPGALLVRDTIVARSQPLLVSDTHSRTGLVNVLSPHRVGADTNDEIVVGAVNFQPASICLQADALGIDHAGPEDLPLDIFGGDREFDVPAMPDIGGIRDIGACERGKVFVDPIFIDGFDVVAR